MDKMEKKNSDSGETPEEKKKKQDKELDEELKQTFPASDPPSISQPDNKDDDG